MFCLKKIVEDVGRLSSSLALIQRACYASSSSSSSRVSKTVRPAGIRGTRWDKKKPIDLEEGDINVRQVEREFRRDVRREFDTKGDIGETEVGLLDLDKDYDEAAREYEKIHRKTERGKMFRRHFREALGEHEISVLTYAEKEKIRYLHTSNPEEWSAEALSVSFPVSVEGVKKLLKSTFRAKSMKEIKEHDEKVAEKIRMMKNGEVEMTPELEEKLRMRDQVPFTIGGIDPYDKNMLLKLEPVKIIGEFQRLVSPREKLKQLETTAVSVQSPNSNEPEETVQPWRMKMPEHPDLGDSYVMERNKRSDRELRRLNISSRRMTFDEFKEKMQLGDKSKDEEIQYVAKMGKKANPTPVSITDFEEEVDNIKNKIINRKYIQKFKLHDDEDHENSQEHTENEMVRQEFKLKQDENDNINVPVGQRKDGSVYRRGDTYYDENGEFLYKVV